MVTETVLFCRSKKRKKTSRGYIRMVSKGRGDLRTIHDENDVLTDDELVVVRGILRKSKHVCLYIRNEPPLGFKLLNHT